MFGLQIRLPISPRTVSITQNGLEFASIITSVGATLQPTGNAISFRVPTPLPQGGGFLATIEQGAVESTTFCGVENYLTMFAVDDAPPGEEKRFMDYHVHVTSMARP